MSPRYGDQALICSTSCGKTIDTTTHVGYNNSMTINPNLPQLQLINGFDWENPRWSAGVCTVAKFNLELARLGETAETIEQHHRASYYHEGRLAEIRRIMKKGGFSGGRASTLCILESGHVMASHSHYEASNRRGYQPYPEDIRQIISSAARSASAAINWYDGALHQPKLERVATDPATQPVTKPVVGTM